MNRIAKNINSRFLLLMLPAGLMAQPGEKSFLQAIVENGDTILVDNIREVIIFPQRTFTNQRDYLKYRRLIRDLKIVHPYAKVAARYLEELNENFIDIKTENEKKKYIKNIEEKIRNQFEQEIKNLTIRQGRLLIKLVDRETGNTSYELVKELKGSFTAAFWQALAKLFGEDLKIQYDPLGEDRLIEEIIILIENGQL